MQLYSDIQKVLNELAQLKDAPASISKREALASLRDDAMGAFQREIYRVRGDIALTDGTQITLDP